MKTIADNIAGRNIPQIMGDVDDNFSELGKLTQGILDDLNGITYNDVAHDDIWNTYLRTTSYVLTVNGTTISFRHTTIDISNYDTVELSGLKNLNAWGHRNWMLFDENLNSAIANGNIADGGTLTINRSDYSAYGTLYLVVQTYIDETTFVPEIVINKNRDFALQTDIEPLMLKINGISNSEIVDSVVWSLYVLSTSSILSTTSTHLIHQHTEYIDISLYDSVKLSGLKSLASWNHKNWMLFDENKTIAIASGNVANGESLTIYRSDYKEYGSLYLVVQSDVDTETYPASIIINISTFDSKVPPQPKVIWFCGDSLTSVLKVQLAKIAENFGYTIAVNNATMGGEKIIGTLTRTGGLPARINTAFTIPTTATAVTIDLTSSWIKTDGSYAALEIKTIGSTNTDKLVRIKNISGYLNISGSDYTFTRLTAGDAVEVGVGELLYFELYWTNRDKTLVFLTGANQGYESIQDAIDMIDSARKPFKKSIVLCDYLGITSTIAGQQLFRKTFGNNFLNLREYMQQSSIIDAVAYGLLVGEYDIADWETELLGDGVHQNDLGGFLQSILIWNKLLELGYVEGDYVTDASLY